MKVSALTYEQRGDSRAVRAGNVSSGAAVLMNDHAGENGMGSLHTAVDEADLDASRNHGFLISTVGPERRRFARRGRVGSLRSRRLARGWRMISWSYRC